MSSTPQRFDLAELHRCIEVARVDREMTNAAVAREAGVAASTIKRYANAADAEADGVLALLGWLDAVPESFVTGSNVEGMRLPAQGEGMIRVDMDRIRHVLRSVTPSRTRTTIQTLVDAAANSVDPSRRLRAGARGKSE